MMKRRSVKLASVLRKLGITHDWANYYVAKSPTHRIPGHLVYKRTRKGAWYVRPENIDAVVKSLPARSQKARAYKARVVQGVVQPEFDFSNRGFRSGFKTGVEAAVRSRRVISPAEEKLLRSGVVNTIRSAAEQLNMGNPATRELVHTGLWHSCYKGFDELRPADGLRKAAVSSGEGMLETIQRKGLIREFHDYVIRECAKRIS